jgi:type II secretory pathway component PulC
MVVIALGTHVINGLAQRATAPDSLLPLRLVGIAIDGSTPTRSAAFIACGTPAEKRSARPVMIGERACDVADVIEVLKDAVVIRNVLTNRIERVALPATASSSASPTAAGGEIPANAADDEVPPPLGIPTAPGVVTIELHRELLHRSLSNLPEVLTAALATPHHADGSLGPIDGYVMTRIKAGGIVDQLGIQEGDVLLDFNGQRLDSLGAVTSLLGQAEALEGATMTVLRSGTTMTFVFKVM